MWVANILQDLARVAQGPLL